MNHRYEYFILILGSYLRSNDVLYTRSEPWPGTRANTKCVNLLFCTLLAGFIQVLGIIIVIRNDWNLSNFNALEISSVFCNDISLILFETTHTNHGRFITIRLMSRIKTSFQWGKRTYVIGKTKKPKTISTKRMEHTSTNLEHPGAGRQKTTLLKWSKHNLFRQESIYAVHENKAKNIQVLHTNKGEIAEKFYVQFECMTL